MASGDMMQAKIIQENRMPKLIVMISLVVLGATLVACGSPDRDASRSEPEPQKKTVFDGMTSTIDRAEGVEDLTEDRMRQLNKKMEEAQGSN
jgi:hypothetical protein